VLYDRIDEINQWITTVGKQRYGFGPNLAETTTVTGVMYCAGFNHFDIDAFIDFLRSLEWNLPAQEIQVMYKSDRDDRYKTIDIFR
jgi:hypothetical protein